MKISWEQLCWCTGQVLIARRHQGIQRIRWHQHESHCVKITWGHFTLIKGVAGERCHSACVTSTANKRAGDQGLNESNQTRRAVVGCAIKALLLWIWLLLSWALRQVLQSDSVVIKKLSWFQLRSSSHCRHWAVVSGLLGAGVWVIGNVHYWAAKKC